MSRHRDNNSSTDIEKLLKDFANATTVVEPAQPSQTFKGQTGPIKNVFQHCRRCDLSRQFYSGECGHCGWRKPHKK